jgi:hypothetical protein
MSHTNEIDNILGHSQDNVNFSVSGNENVLLLGFGILLILVVCFVGRKTCVLSRHSNSGMVTHHILGYGEKPRENREFKN